MSAGVIRVIDMALQQNIPYLYVLEFLIAIVQFNIVDKIWGKKKNVKNWELAVLNVLIFFSPIQLVRAATEDLGGFKELLFYLSVEQVLITDS